MWHYLCHSFKRRLNDEEESDAVQEVQERFLSMGEKLGVWGKKGGWGDALKSNAEVSAMSFGVLTLSTAFNAAFLANNILEMQEGLFWMKMFWIVEQIAEDHQWRCAIFGAGELKINLTED